MRPGSRRYSFVAARHEGILASGATQHRARETRALCDFRVSSVLQSSTRSSARLGAAATRQGRQRQAGSAHEWAGLRALAADAARQLDVLGHDGDALGVDGAQVGVLKQANQVGLGCLLQRQDGGALEAQVRLEVLRNLANQALEGQLADEQLRALLVLANLAARRTQQREGPSARGARTKLGNANAGRNAQRARRAGHAARCGTRRAGARGASARRGRHR